MPSILLFIVQMRFMHVPAFLSSAIGSADPVDQTKPHRYCCGQCSFPCFFSHTLSLLWCLLPCSCWTFFLPLFTTTHLPPWSSRCIVPTRPNLHNVPQNPPRSLLTLWFPPSFFSYMQLASRRYCFLIVVTTSIALGLNSSQNAQDSSQCAMNEEFTRLQYRAQCLLSDYSPRTCPTAHKCCTREGNPLHVAHPLFQFSFTSHSSYADGEVLRTAFIFLSSLDLMRK